MFHVNNSNLAIREGQDSKYSNPKWTRDCASNWHLPLPYPQTILMAKYCIFGFFQTTAHESRTFNRGSDKLCAPLSSGSTQVWENLQAILRFHHCPPWPLSYLLLGSSVEGFHSLEQR